MIEPRLPGAVEFAAAAERIGVAFVVGARGVGLRRTDRAGVRGGQDVDDQAWNVCGAAGFAQYRAACDVGAQLAGTVGRQVPAGCRHVGAPG